MIFVSASSGVYVFNYNPGWIYVKKMNSCKLIGYIQKGFIERKITSKSKAIHLHRLETIKERMNRILAENTGKSVETVTADCERDNFMTAETAMTYGLIRYVLNVLVKQAGLKKTCPAYLVI